MFLIEGGEKEEKAVKIMASAVRVELYSLVVENSKALSFIPWCCRNQNSHINPNKQ